MIRGLVIGKFMPVHNGHIALINFAASKCDELIVSMSYTENNLIPVALRLQWMKDIFIEEPKIKYHLIEDNFDDENSPLPERTKAWAQKMRQCYPPVNIIFSSENYGASFAENLGAKHISFDPARTSVPVSATLIRARPLTYWNYIPKNVQPFFVKKICFYGPESTGKTYMSKLMAEHYKTAWVPETARDMLDSNVFTEDDIIKIALAHDKAIQSKLQVADKLLFCDTDIITTQIYSQYYLNVISPILFKIEKQTVYDLYFLMDIDTPWVSDHLRDHGERRQEMFCIFKSQLDKRNIPHTIIQGDYKQRKEKTIAVINKLLSKF